MVDAEQPKGLSAEQLHEAEKLDYVPGVLTVEQHVRDKWAYAKYRTLIQASVPAPEID